MFISGLVLMCTSLDVYKRFGLDVYKSMFISGLILMCTSLDVHKRFGLVYKSMFISGLVLRKSQYL